jgi:hypothetical protein
MSLTRNFVTCPNHTSVPDEVWMSYLTSDWTRKIEPDNGKQIENCVHLYVGPEHWGLMDSMCIENRRYICQITT